MEDKDLSLVISAIKKSTLGETHKEQLLNLLGVYAIGLFSQETQKLLGAILNPSSDQSVGSQTQEIIIQGLLYYLRDNLIMKEMPFLHNHPENTIDWSKVDSYIESATRSIVNMDFLDNEAKYLGTMKFDIQRDLNHNIGSSLRNIFDPIYIPESERGKTLNLFMQGCVIYDTQKETYSVNGEKAKKFFDYFLLRSIAQIKTDPLPGV